jgi:surface protein
VESSGLKCCSRATDAANCGAGGQIDMSGWDVSMVTDMAGLFQQKFSFNQDISAWNVSLVTDMQSMFDGAVAFNADISKWNTMA